MTAIDKQDGTTPAERRLARLCAKSFLTLWSYPGVYRDQNKRGGGDGKEVCDLLVVFGDDLIIFSDKDCRFPESGRLDQDWARWFRRAVQKSADQLWGADRWIRENPERVFVDRRCTQRLPVPLPDPGRARVHRVLVAHDASRRCREVMGGSGCLVIMPGLTGSAHVDGPANLPGFEQGAANPWARAYKPDAGYAGTNLPFVVGDLDPDKGFVHVFDDAGLDAVLNELDTASDFVAYLRGREQYLRSGRLVMAAGEDELLAHYLCCGDDDARRSFHEPGDPESGVVIPEGSWGLLRRDPVWVARKQADRVSYYWDEVIERFNVGILDGTGPAYPQADFARQELAVRVMARETRLRRRALALFLSDFLATEQAKELTARVVSPTRSGSPYYIFIALRPRADEDRGAYRRRRQAVAYAYAVEAKRKFPDAKEVVALATEPFGSEWASEDVLYRGEEPLTDSEIESVREYVQEQGVLTKLGEPARVKVLEYPDVRVEPPPERSKGTMSRSLRNSLCGCGSGKKSKKCCMKP